MESHYLNTSLFACMLHVLRSYSIGPPIPSSSHAAEGDIDDAWCFVDGSLRDDFDSP